MATDPSHIADLLHRYHQGILSEDDRQELDAWRAESPENEELYRELTDEELVADQLRMLDAIDTGGLRTRILSVMPDAFGVAVEPILLPRRRLMHWRWVAAAVLLGLVGIGIWRVAERGVKAKTDANATAHDVAAPARSRATLTLAGGKTIFLDSVGKGQVAEEGGARVVRQDGNVLAYQAGGQVVTHGEILYNLLTNPRGSQVINLTLADGSRVWLNAGSSIRYPVLFAGTDRTVEMTGEAYFEVTKDAARPFRVAGAGQSITVLGTGFNVKAYDDEAVVRSTLAEGGIRVETAGEEKRLQPGQQAVYDPAGRRLTVNPHADLDLVLAWKNGRFAFADADLQTVMRELARWYDVTVRYEGAVPQKVFSGKIGKTLSLEQVLHILTNHKIHYTIQPDRILILQP